MNTYNSSFYLKISLLVLTAILSIVAGKLNLKSERLCDQCSKCETSSCPASESYPHMTAFDDSLIAGALQSDFVNIKDRGVYSVPFGNGTIFFNIYHGWESTSGSALGFHRFRNYMDKCSGEQSYLTVDKQGKAKLRSLSSLHDLSETDWKSLNPPKKLNHRSFRFRVPGNTGKCPTVLGEKTRKRKVGVSECKLDGSNPLQLFAFRFHYHNAFCCCGLHNN